MSIENKQQFIVADTKRISLVYEEIKFDHDIEENPQLKTKTHLTFKISVAGKKIESGATKLMLGVKASLELQERDSSKPLVRYQSEHRQLLEVSRHDGIEDIETPPIDAINPYLRPLLLIICKRAEHGLLSVGFPMKLPLPDQYEAIKEDAPAKASGKRRPSKQKVDS